MNETWVKSYRKSIDNPVWRDDPTAWRVFEALMWLADHKTGEWNGGRLRLAEFCNLNPNTTWSATDRLVKAKMVNRSSNSKFTTFSICNWGKYQQGGNSPSNNESTTNQQPINNESTLYKEYKEVKNIRTKENVTNVTSYGKPEINEILKNFETDMELHLSRVPQQRRAAQTLLTRHGLPKVLDVIKAASHARGQQYAPVIVSLEDLRDKWNNLEEFYRRATTSQRKNEIMNV
jgi:hypothetical protein